MFNNNLQETVNAFMISNIKNEEIDDSDQGTKSSCSDFENDNIDDIDWSQSRNDTSSSDEDFKLINIKLEEDESKPQFRVKSHNDSNGAFKIIVDKYPQVKDGKKLQVRCRLCLEVFESILGYKDHFMENHANEEKDENCCRKCNLTFENRKTLLEHFRLLHENFNCTKCKRQFASQHQLNEHFKKEHEDKPASFMCSYCGKIYATQVSLNLHVDAIHLEAQHSCDMCDKVYSFKSALYKHRQLAHIKGKSHKCDQCTFIAGTKHEIKLHKNNHHNFNRENTRSDMACGDCGMQFHNESTLKRHRFYQHGVTLLRYKQKCLYCEEPIPTSTKADRHVSQVHLNGERPLRNCGYCKVEIKNYEEYKEHIESHPGVYICIICGDAHFTAELLSAHAKTHSIMEMDLRKFVCDHCGHRTFKKAQMIVHLTKHSTVPDLHTCEICGKGFKIYSSLYTHRLYHNEGTIPCSSCDKKFVRNADLKTHYRKYHSLEKPFK